MQPLAALIFTALVALSSVCATPGVEDWSLAPRADEFYFDYTGITGPLGWTRKTENPLCSTGRHQSPINIDSSIAVNSENVILSMTDGTYNFTNTGHTLRVDAPGIFSLGSKNYQLAQFHFHTPSEHHIGGEFYSMEMHMVFQTTGAKADDPYNLVIGILFDVSATETTELLDALATNIPVNPSDVVQTETLIFGPLINQIQTQGLYTYQGSLTTPPCTEGFTWLLSKTVMPVDVATFQAFKTVMKFNSRYTQNTPGQENLITFAKDNYP